MLTTATNCPALVRTLDEGAVSMVTSRLCEVNMEQWSIRDNVGGGGITDDDEMIDVGFS